MKKLFYFGLLFLLLFEVANVYFIMPVPGSQDMNSVGAAYFLHSFRWWFRGLFGLMVLSGFRRALQGSKWWSVTAILIAAYVAYTTNFDMAADTMFYQPSVLIMRDTTTNKIESERLVLGVALNGEAKAYPIQFLGYHHQVRDSIGRKPVMITYCTVCRTGRVFEPLVNGKTEAFRLVGMDHFNAMFEDNSTKSWWRQVTGEAVAGPLKGQMLPEFPSVQTTLAQWLKLYPGSLIMQPDPKFQAEYDSMSTYERGRIRGQLTRRDTASWKDKSWVAGLVVGHTSKAYDWNSLVKQRIIYDEIEGRPVAVILSGDDNSFVALRRTHSAQKFTLVNDTLKTEGNVFNLMGRSLTPDVHDLERVQAYQEYWHSWRTFHPTTLR